MYGPADTRSVDFLGEIQAKVVAVAAAHLPIVVGSDFNLIRSGADKNNDDIYWPCMVLFNNAIVAMVLREVARSGAWYTWTNKQLAPVCLCPLNGRCCSPYGTLSLKLA